MALAVKDVYKLLFWRTEVGVWLLWKQLRSNGLSAGRSWVDDPPSSTTLCWFWEGVALYRGFSLLLPAPQSLSGYRGFSSSHTPEVREAAEISTLFHLLMLFNLLCRWVCAVQYVVTVPPTEEEACNTPCAPGYHGLVATSINDVQWFAFIHDCFSCCCSVFSYSLSSHISKFWLFSMGKCRMTVDKAMWKSPACLCFGYQTKVLIL